jgi:hypothetical protein
MKTYTWKPSPSPSTADEGAPPPPEIPPPPAAAPVIVQATAGADASPQTEAQAPMPAVRVKEYRPIDPGVQWVPAPKPPTLLEILPAEYETTRPPLLYRLSTVSEPGRPDGRIAESRTYRARAFSCGFFYKPISRCLVEWEERRDEHHEDRQQDR